MKNLRFNELLEKRSNLTATIFEEEELFELSKGLSETELKDIDRKLLTYSIRERHNNILSLLDDLDKLISK